MPELPYHLERTILIRAKPEIVFQFFADSARWASWWGAGSTVEPTAGGKVYIRHPNGVESLGEVLDVHPAEGIEFTYGFASGKPMPPGASRVVVRLNPSQDGTQLQLRHEFSDVAARDQHVQGWRFQLSLLANAVANEVFAGAAEAVDAWFELWTVSDQHLLEQTLAQLVTPEIQFRNQYSVLDGIADLSAHIRASQRFMPGMGLKRKGDVRHCQGSVLADWVAVDSNGQQRMSGTSLFVFAPDAKIDSVTGFANPAP